MHRSSRVAILLAPIALTAPLVTAAPQACPVATVEAQLTPSQAVKEGGYGTTLSFSGDTLVSSAPLEDAGSVKDTGAVYVLTRSGSSWQEQARLVSTNPSPFDFFGLGLALDGDTLAVGAPFADGGGADAGSVTVFVRNGSNWSVQATLTAPPQNGALFGWDVDLDGDRLVVGAPSFNSGAGADSGGAFVYERNGTTWTLEGTLFASDTSSGDYFGYSVAIQNTWVVAGAYGKGSLNEGGAYIFQRSAGIWTEQANLMEASPKAQRLFGYEVAIEGNLAFIGAPSTALIVPQPGSVYVFQRIGNLWSELLELNASNGEPLDFYGGRIYVVGDRLAVTARDNDQAYVYLQTGQAWPERLILNTTEAGVGRFEGLALDGNTLLLGAPFDAPTGVPESGNSVSMRFTNAQDPSTSYCTAGTSASGCQAQITACGTPSATTTGGFALVASNLEGDKDGLFFFGLNGRQANPWGNSTSFQCVVPPIFRGGLIQGTGNTGLCDGVTKQDLNGLWCSPGCPSPGKNPGVGTLVQAQFWYRDPLSTSNQTTSFSNALEFTVGP